MAKRAQDFSVVIRRRDSIVAYLKRECPYCVEEQKHLDERTTERYYWHYGYLVALRDMLRFLGIDDGGGCCG